MTTRLFRSALLFAAIVCTPALLQAHHAEFMVDKAFSQGMSMPLHGVDHMLVIIAVGLIAAQLGGRAVWAIPSVFMVSILMGGLLNVAGVPIPFLEFGILASVALCGGMLAWGRAMSLTATVGTVSVFAVLHGEALIANDGFVRSLPLFVLGCVASAAFLLAIGISLGVLLRKAHQTSGYRYAGFAVIAIAVVIGAFPNVNDFAIRLLEN